MQSMNTESLASLFKALSEPVRLRILNLFLSKKGEICVCDLVDTLGLSQSVISRHLAYLRHNNILTARREGVWMYYQFTTYAKTDLVPLFDFMRQTIAECEVMQADLENYQKNNCCA